MPECFAHMIELCYKLACASFFRNETCKWRAGERITKFDEMLHCCAFDARIQLIYEIVDVSTIAVLHRHDSLIPDTTWTQVYSMLLEKSLLHCRWWITKIQLNIRYRYNVRSDIGWINYMKIVIQSNRTKHKSWIKDASAFDAMLVSFTVMPRTRACIAKSNIQLSSILRPSWRSSIIAFANQMTQPQQQQSASPADLSC